MFRTAFRALFALAIMAQLAGPALAANAKALNLLCPSHPVERVEAHDHSSHGTAAHHHAGHPEHADTGRETGGDESARKYFDLSCCSVHLTGVIPIESPSVAGLRDQVQILMAEGSASAFPVSIDPPPRILL